jgi:T-complex protein 1 subunit beta
MGAQEESGENARMSMFVGAIALGDMIKTTLGPKGMDKILKSCGSGPRSEKISVTNDGATILSAVHIDNAAAKILIDISKTQDEEVGDGTTTVCVLAAELLREAEKLLQAKIHPQVVIQGWRLARDAAKERLEEIAMDNSPNEAAFREDLLNVARTTLSSKLLTYEKEHFAKLAVDAVLRLKGSNNLELIQIIKKTGGTLKDSFLADGFLLEKQISVGCSRSKKTAKIMVANTPMDYDKVKIYGTKVKVDSVEKVAEVEQAEREKMKKKCERIMAYKPDIFINRQLIYNYPEQILADAGIMVIEHADFEGVERLANATGAEIVSTFFNPERSEEVLGFSADVSEIMIGEDKLIHFNGCKRNESCSLVLRGSSSHILDEAERSMHDAICVLVKTVQNKQVLLGGGNSEMQMAQAVEELLLTGPVRGKQAIAVKAFATALKKIPAIIADNGGFDSSEIVQNLEFEIKSDNVNSGININDGSIGDMKVLGIRECLRVKEQALISACEAAEMILRCDKIVSCAPRERQKMGLHN